MEPKTDKVNHWVDQVHDLNHDNNASIFQDYFESATVHGLNKAIKRKYSRFRRGFWLLAFLGMLTALLYTVFYQVADMMSYPTITQQSIEFRTKMPFPAVTLCNLNLFRTSRINDDGRLQQLVLSQSQFGSSITFNWSDSRWDTSDPDGFEKHLEFIAHSLIETLYFCTWNKKNVPCTDIFVTQKTDFGMCYTFNGIHEENDTALETTHSGSKYGLSVIANIIQQDYMLSASSDAAGLRVVLHDPMEYPLVDGKGFEVAPGTSSKASIKMTTVKMLPPPFRSYDNTQCINTTTEKFKNHLKQFERYSYAACIAECRYNYILEACGCRSVFDRGNDSICLARNSVECYDPYYEKFMDENKDLECDCPTPCEMRLFDAEISTSMYPSSAMIKEVNRLFNINISEQEFRSNYLKLTLAYDKFVAEEIRQVPQYTFETIMSTLGGQLGIFIGASIISVLEFIEFGLEFIFYKCLRMGNKTGPKP